MKPTFGISAALLLCAALQCPGQGTFQSMTITFDGPPTQPRGTDYSIYTYQELGMSFSQYRRVGTNTTASDFGRCGGGLALFPDNGTTYIQAGSTTDTLVCEFTDGRLFQPTALDLAEYSTVSSGPDTIHLAGYGPGGRTYKWSLTTDGIIDGTGPLVDFQTFNVVQVFGWLNRLEISTDRGEVSLDNLVLNVVPEPASGTLILAGGLVLWLVRRRNGAQTPL